MKIHIQGVACKLDDYEPMLYSWNIVTKFGPH